MEIWANNRARVLVTEDCNLKCSYCHNEGQPFNKAKISDDLIHRIDELMKLSIKKNNGKKLDAITFSGGEPLLHKQLFNYIETLSPHAKRSTLITNGVLLNKTKLNDIISSGITKIRLGVDSITNSTARPTKGNICNEKILERISLLLDNRHRIPFELNIVLSDFNNNQLDKLISFCCDNKISAKFFELVRVKQFGDIGNEALLQSQVSIPYNKFQNIIFSSYGSNILTLRNSEDMNEADKLFEGDGFTLRYCHFLCDYGLCYKTGTRIDAEGAVYTCMNRRGKLWISSIEPLQTSYNTIIKANQERCIKCKSN